MTFTTRHRRALFGLLFVCTVVMLPAAGLSRHAASAVHTAPRQSSGTVLPNGRLVTPAGTTIDLGDFPLGLALSPDGALAVAINSGQGSGLNSGFGSYCSYPPCPYSNPSQPVLTATVGYSNTPTYDESLSVVNLHTNQAQEVKAVPTSYNQQRPQFNFFYAGIVFSPDGSHLYATGGGNDAVYDFPVQNDVVASAPSRTTTLSDTVKDQPPLILYGHGQAFTRGLAVTPNGRYLLVAHEFQNAVDIVDTRTFSATQVPLDAPAAVGGAHPYGLAVSHDGSTAYVAEEGLNQIAVIKLFGGSGVVVATVAVGDHPTAVALSPDGTQLYVTNTNDDTLSVLTVATNGVPTLAATIPMHAFPGEQLGSMPDAVSVSPDGQRLYVALAGDNAVLIVGTAASLAQAGTGAATVAAAPDPQSLSIGGAIPTGWYPSAVMLSSDGATVYVASAKGLGSRYLPPYVPQPQTGAITSTYDYDGNNMPGLLQSVPAPSGSALLAGLTTVRQNIAYATYSDALRSPHNPIPTETLTGTTSLTASVRTPIKYVIEIVRENRTFDQVLGDLAVNEGRNQPGTDTVNAYPGYTIFGQRQTPNAHALVGDPTGGPTAAFATNDAFYSDGEASVQGHWWTAGANATDYTEKAWIQYYSSRNHFQDPVAAIAQPKHCSIFQAAQARKAANPLGAFTYRNYGELVGLKIPSVLFPVGSNNPPCSVPLIGNSDLSAPIIKGAVSLDHDDRSVASEFLNDIGLNSSGQVITPTRSLRNFSYLYLGGDHTGGLSFANTPRSRVAQNDAALGLVVRALSHSKYWPNTAILVMEDDSQDGLDHVDGHRNVLYVISPYAKHVGNDGKPGYVGHTHYSQVSVLKTIELLLGLPYLSSFDQNASPLYDLFQDKDGTPGHTLTAADLTPFTLQPAPSFIDESSSTYAQQAGASADLPRAESMRLDLSGIDRAGPLLEVVNWQLAHPDRALPAQLVHERQVWDRQHGISGDD